MKQRRLLERKWLFVGCLAGMIAVLTGLAAADGNRPVRLAYRGAVYEAPLVAALRQDFFKAEGLRVELVKTDWQHFTPGSAARWDGMTADYRTFALIQRGLRVKLVAGLHGNCVCVATKPDSKITSLRDLKGKIVGVANPGDGPSVVLSRLFRDLPGDPGLKTTWKPIPVPLQRAALTEGKIAAAAAWEGRTESKTPACAGRVIFMSARDRAFLEKNSAFPHFYGSFIALGAGLIRNEPPKAAAVARAWLRAAQWVGEHPAATARLIREQSGAIPAPDLERQLKDYLWMPGVAYARENIRWYIREQKELGILNPCPDPERFFKEVYAPIIPDLKQEAPSCSMEGT